MADNTIWLRAYVRAIAHDVDRMRNQIAALEHVLLGADAKLRQEYDSRLASLETISREAKRYIADTSLPEEDRAIERLREKFDHEESQ